MSAFAQKKELQDDPKAAGLTVSYTINSSADKEAQRYTTEVFYGKLEMLFS